ncbi:hypothetical protein BU25DRAFT_415732 [Macroventuria anomochaeta]|uniref:Uncharacterized protein n=1 Tax=Macroventuria anomochaeta TaxID=301207 RepID=A0ACB6RJH4_9PLEO|nr:uncharacterized protein BU25DRAFT_415732 [Macroventuria anomochaeta]KAF2621883.1 hypothetical protein BU25DRAFT_415732 [Macroventuria anomochaeta]
MPGKKIADGAAKQPLPHLPDEIVGEIGAKIVDPKDFCNFRRANKRFSEATKYAQGKRIANVTVYPRFAGMKALLAAVQDVGVAKYVRNITLLAEGLKEHEFGYVWAWEDLQIWADLQYTQKDVKIINNINAAHADDVVVNGDFIITGQYRLMLTTLLERLPNLATITVRKLAPGEHIPGWSGVKLFKELSFYRDGLDTRQIFYGDWQYDILHRRITHYRDEYGDLISEPDAGPQASFVDDLKAAMSASGTEAKVAFLPVARYENC